MRDTIFYADRVSIALPDSEPAEDCHRVILMSICIVRSDTKVMPIYTKKEPKTKGTAIAEKARARSNGLTSAKLQRNLAKAMTLIYGGGIS